MINYFQKGVIQPCDMKYHENKFYLPGLLSHFEYFYIILLNIIHSGISYIVITLKIKELGHCLLRFFYYCVECYTTLVINLNRLFLFYFLIFTVLHEYPITKLVKELYHIRQKRDFLKLASHHKNNI